jgi:hypothetical protein
LLESSLLAWDSSAKCTATVVHKTDTTRDDEWIWLES